MGGCGYLRGSLCDDTSYRTSLSRKWNLVRLSCSAGTSSKLKGLSWRREREREREEEREGGREGGRERGRERGRGREGEREGGRERERERGREEEREREGGREESIHVHQNRQSERSNIYLSEDEVSYLVINESALGKVDEPVAMEIRIPVVQKGQV